MLSQIIYCSVASHLFSEDELNELLRVSRRYNERNGITGILLYSEGNFFQVLEGEEAVIDELYARIKEDGRHDQVVQIVRESISARTFKNWTMGYAVISSDDVNEIVGANDSSSDETPFSSLGESRAKKLVFAFDEGNWRTKIVIQ